MSNEIVVSVGSQNEYQLSVGRGIAVTVFQPLRSHQYWSEREWTPNEPVQEANIRCSLPYGVVSPDVALQMADLLLVAGDICTTLNRQAEPQLAEQRRRKREIEERERREAEEKSRARNELKDLLQNYVGQTFKLRRDGYKATVFGTVDRFTDTTVFTTSERGVPMSTMIASINFFAIKWEGERRYETVYDRSVAVGQPA